MPELPEVETIAAGLRRRLEGEQIVAAEVYWPRSVAVPSVAEFVSALVGRHVREVWRRGKFVVLALDAGYLLIHLRMTGRLLLHASDESGQPWEPYVRARLRFASGLVLSFVDVRKFGRLYVVNDLDEIVGSLGAEPLSASLGPRELGNLLRSRRRQLKPLLLDQRVLAGLGNIYVDETLWAAGLHPLRRSDTLSDQEIERLHRAIQEVLRQAVRNQGTTLRDYRNVADQVGEHQAALAVYGRAGEPCPRCGCAIVRELVGGRGTHYCPHCQRLPPFPKRGSG
ncbi:MAG: DNA-formamidopyrimidine glycosylase [Chloroflexi bacterium]|nr:DNA-formamidopyrimidine glycosylase [Chloroflexota bacterium]